MFVLEAIPGTICILSNFNNYKSMMIIHEYTEYFLMPS